MPILVLLKKKKDLMKPIRSNLIRAKQETDCIILNENNLGKSMSLGHSE